MLCYLIKTAAEKYDIHLKKKTKRYIVQALDQKDCQILGVLHIVSTVKKKKKKVE